MSTKIEGIWIGQKDLTHDEDFIRDAQLEMQEPSLAQTLSKEGALGHLDGNRRDFLKMLGFGVSAAAIAAGCDIPVKRAIPYVVKPDAIVPGVASYYASSYNEGGDYCSILVKTREGRPIKIEGNELSAVTRGGTSARAQAYVLGLYDTNRLKYPTIEGEKVSWEVLDKTVKSILSASKGIRIITNTVLSPSAKRVMSDFTQKYPSTQMVTFDPVSSAGILAANETSFGLRAIPSYHFDKADIIVSFNADFLGTWISPIEYSNQYAKRRKIEDVKNLDMNRHVQVEAGMSMTGSNADHRILVKPSEQGASIAYLYNALTGRSGGSDLNDKAKQSLSALATQLKQAKGRSLVVSGSNIPAEQTLVNAINAFLGNYGSTISFSDASMQRQGDEAQLGQLVEDIKNGEVQTVIFHKANPTYQYSAINGLKEALERVPNKIALSYEMDESGALCSIVAPVHHGLESWGDAEAKKGELTLSQPVIAPLFDTRQAETSLLAWCDSEAINLADVQSYGDYVKQTWSQTAFANQNAYLSFQTFWDKALHDGVYHYTPVEVNPEFVGDTASALGSITSPASTELEINFFEPITIGNGQFANNPWLQEMPDPVTRTTWGNYLAVPVSFDGVRKFKGMNNLTDGELVEISIAGKSVTVPVVQQFGQMPGTVSLALGYGRSVVGDAGRNVGSDINPCLTVSGGRVHYYSTEAIISRSKGKEKHYSSVQYHHTMGVTAEERSTGQAFNADEAALAPGYGNIFSGFQGALTDRTIIRKANVDVLGEAIENLKHEREHHESLNKETLYPYEKFSDELYSQGHHWGMHVDLNACTGCGACTVACMAENNVPVVGKKQVARHQEMAWLRIDRYYFGDVENPNVVYQPMMCQHCDNAPCENVCPVNATNHSGEGLNQMTYNRCIGTRYCANNCPYKVRRFNWLDYTTADIFPANQVKVNEEEIPYGAENLTRMVLNPDVTVRVRGVIEKCSFCVQRIQEGKLTAKTEGRKLFDSDVKTACQTSCPTGAITFGDRNNSEGVLAKKFNSPLNMIVLEEINVRSSVQYTMKVTNRDESLA